MDLNIPLFFDTYWNENSERWIQKKKQSKEQWIALVEKYSIVGSLDTFTLAPLNPILWTPDDQNALFDRLHNGYRLALLVNSGKHLARDEIKVLFNSEKVQERIQKLQMHGPCFYPVMSPLMEHLVNHTPEVVSHILKFQTGTWSQPISYVINMAKYIASGQASTSLVDAFAIMIQKYPSYPLKHKEAALLKLYLMVSERQNIMHKMPDAHIYKATDRKDTVLQNTLKRTLYESCHHKDWSTFLTGLSVLLNVQTAQDMVACEWDDIASVYHDFYVKNQNATQELPILI